MRLWRIAQQQFALDKSCMGAVRYGGRWNPPGVGALYCGTTIALRALEKVVHIGVGTLPPQCLVAVDIPDNCAIADPDPMSLPAGWDALPSSPAAQAFGGRWLTSVGQLGMLVPSVIVNEEKNVVLNPGHPDFALVSLKIVRPFVFDQRFYRAP